VKSIFNIHSVIERSRVNGPGERLVVFAQGCGLKCPGCFNTALHTFESAIEIEPKALLKEHLLKGIEGITVSGGEPFEQPQPLLALLKEAKEKYHLTTVVYSGFTHKELLKMSESRNALAYIDVLIDAMFKEEEKESTLLARGSTNQSFIFLTDRYTLKDFYMPAKVEISIGPDGAITGTGFSNHAFKVKEAV
jgi:anaerobic ribonucleoside-triphosphate reductase activating protein